MDNMKVDLVREAERIVGGYPAKPARAADKKRRDKAFDMLLNVIMAMSCVLLAVVLRLGLG